MVNYVPVYKKITSVIFFTYFPQHSEKSEPTILLLYASISRETSASAPRQSIIQNKVFCALG